MANKKSNHLENHAEIEHEIDVNKDLDLAKQDTTENEHVDPKVEDKQATMQHKENENRQSSASTPNETVIVKKNGTALSVVAILIALGLGGSGYYFGQQQVDEMQQKLTALQTQLQQKNTAEPVNLPSFEAEKTQLAKLAEFSQVASDQISALNQELAAKEQQLSALQQQVQRLTNQSKSEQPNDWLLTEADFLLNNALRKLVLDNDVDTSVSLLKVAGETLSKVAMPQVATVRSAINADLKKLLSLNNVDQNAIMQELSQLANDVDELNVLNANFDEDPNTDKLTDSLEDWKSNAEKSAVSFLNHFIRITPKKADNKALLAPNQDIYLRENIRLRLQIAILAVPRQQDDLYKQSLETVASWVRTYFDTSTEVAQNFLKKLDELAEQSIYVDVPTQLSSLNALDKLLNKQPQEVQKITLSADKDFDPENVKATENHAASPAEQGNGADTSTVPNQPEQQEK